MVDSQESSGKGGSDLASMLAKGFQMLMELLAALPAMVFASLRWVCLEFAVLARLANAALLSDCRPIRYALALCQAWPQGDETPCRMRVTARPCVPHAP